ncbi:MAG TPA: PEGA domain-containing protein [Treponema sp.]|nr:PEGA domain-containing protein [Treponema sp.]
MNDKKFWLIGMVLFGIFSQTLSAKEPVQDAYIETDGAGLSVYSVPRGALVYIDGIQRGITPLSLPSLPPGKYQLMLAKEGYENRSVLVTLAEGKHLDLTLVLALATGQLVINVERAPGAPGSDILPLYADLYIDDKQTSVFYQKLPVGLHRIRVEAFGWEPVEKVVMVFQDLTQILTIFLEPAQFRVSGFRSERQRFNPYNPGLLGSTDFSFSVTAKGTGHISIYDSNNSLVYEHRFEPFTERNQRWTWNGRDRSGTILSDGVYTVVLSTTSVPYNAQEPVQIDERTSINIDSSLVIRPWSVGSGGAGLLYLSIPETLAPASFQMDSRLAFGFPYGAQEPFTSVPFSLGLRFAPADTWECAVSGEFDASRDPAANQASFTLRKTWLKGSHHLPLSAGLDLSWTLAEIASRTDPSVISWSGSQGGPRLGLSFLMPLGAHVGVGLSPALLWPMDTHTLSSGPIPDLELGAGLIGTGTTITGGLSAKLLWHNKDGREASWQAGPLFAAAELHWFPRPSVFVFHLAGGLWYISEKSGAFGSFGIGIIH